MEDKFPQLSDSIKKGLALVLLVLVLLILQLSLLLYMTQPCAQMNNTPQLLAEYIQVGGCLCALRAQGWGIYIF